MAWRRIAQSFYETAGELHCHPERRRLTLRARMHRRIGSLGVKRRRFLQTGIAGAALANSACSSVPPLPAGPPGRSAVAILRADSYARDLASLLRRGAQLCGL